MATQPASTEVASTDAAATQPSVEASSTDVSATQPAALQASTNASSTDVATQPTEAQTPSPEFTSQATADATESAVAALANSGSVLTDQNGNAIPLASQQAADILGTGDPYIIRGGTTYHFSTI